MSAQPILEQDPHNSRPAVNFVPKPLVLQVVVVQIIKIASSGRDDMLDQMEHAIAGDPGFSARMLATANSASYALRSQVTSVKQAVCMLGVKGVKSLALTVGTGDIFQCTNKEDAIRAKLWWRLSRDSAVLARWMATERRLPCGEDAYIATLLHLVGKMQFIHSAPGTYGKVEALMGIGRGVVEAERLTYGISASELSEKAIKEWGLPDGMISSSEDEDVLSAGDLATVRALSAIARDVCNPDGLPDEHEFPAWAVRQLKIERFELSDLVKRGREMLVNVSREG